METLTELAPLTDLSGAKSKKELATKLRAWIIETMSADDDPATAAREREYHERNIVLVDPDRGKRIGVGDAWRVMWEGGPFEWGVTFSLSMSLEDPSVLKFFGRRVKIPSRYFLEPYYSFDVGVYDA